MSHAQTRSQPAPALGDALAVRYAALRNLSEALVAPLSDADATIQSMEDASPAKWHLAHTTWFWETFLLRDHLDGYALFDDDWPFVFNSYYEAEGERIARFSRGMLSRPTLEEILAWRTHVDEAQNLSHAGLSRGYQRGATDNIPGLQTMPTQGGHSKSE